MKAKEMFEKLGYEVEYNNEECLMYTKYVAFDDVDAGIEYKVMFDKKYKSIGSITYDMFMPIDWPELQAINKQIEELGWNK